MTRTLTLTTAILLTAPLLFTTAPLAAKGGAAPRNLGSGDEPAAKAREALRAFREAKGLDSLLPSKGGPTCNELDPERIDCNSVTTHTLRASACLLDDGTVFDVYVFEGRAGDEVEIDLTSDDFDTVLFLLNPLGELFEFDDDGGEGTNSLLAVTLDEDGTWAIAVNNFAPVTGNPGVYTLSLSCTSPDCATTATAMCLNQDRFRVEVEWTDFEGMSGSARTVSLPVASDDSGIFYFFSANNWELLIKVLNGCGINGHYWVFGAATTNVQYTVRVTDTRSGQVKTFFNPLGVSSRAITSTDAFDTCP